MARIRTIKPEFWTDGAIIALPYEVRLFYIGMWNNACDRGHLPDDPLGLKLKILPADPVDGASLVAALMDAGRVTRMVLPDGRPFLTIPRFADHQRVDTRWNSRCPVCTHMDSAELTETHASSAEDADSASDLGCSETHANSRKLTPGREGRGKEGKGEGGADAQLSPYCRKHPNGTEDPCRGCATAREKYQAAQKAQRSRPAPRPFTVLPGSVCPDGKHRWQPDGTCRLCTARKNSA